jgi:hypothetical protein
MSISCKVIRGRLDHCPFGGQKVNCFHADNTTCGRYNLPLSLTFSVDHIAMGVSMMRWMSTMSSSYNHLFRRIWLGAPRGRFFSKNGLMPSSLCLAPEFSSPFTAWSM